MYILTSRGIEIFRYFLIHILIASNSFLKSIRVKVMFAYRFSKFKHSFPILDITESIFQIYAKQLYFSEAKWLTVNLKPSRGSGKGRL